jgi:hypothetical protein
VENFGGRPYPCTTFHRGRDCNTRFATSTEIQETPLFPGRRSLTLSTTLRYHLSFSAIIRPLQGIRHHEAYVPAEPPPPREDPRVPRAHEHQKRASGAEAAACQGTKAPHSFLVLTRVGDRLNSRDVPAVRQNPASPAAWRIPKGLRKRPTCTWPLPDPPGRQESGINLPARDRRLPKAWRRGQKESS